MVFPLILCSYKYSIKCEICVFSVTEHGPLPQKDGHGAQQLKCTDESEIQDDLSGAANALLLLSSWVPGQGGEQLGNLDNKTRPRTTSTTVTSGTASACDITFESATQVTPQKRRKYATGTSITPPMSVGVQRTPVKYKHKALECHRKVKTSSVGPDAPYLVDKCTGNHVICSDKAVQAGMANMCIELIKDFAKDMKNYTGLNSYGTFVCLHKYLVAKCDDENCEVDLHKKDPEKEFPFLTTENQLLLVLMKLRRNQSELCISKQMGISQGSVSGIFHFWIELMYRKFKLLNLCPAMRQIQHHMPESLKHDYPNLREIYDGTEVKCQKPSDPLAQRQLWSTYKHDHTVKIQLGCESTGAITSISNTYGGSISDKDLFQQSAVIEHLHEGEAVMVDKGYLILDVLQGSGVQLIRPPFLNAREQFSQAERDESRKISRYRILIENVNARVKQYTILSGRISLLFLPIINEIIYICCCLSNLDKPLRK